MEGLGAIQPWRSPMGNRLDGRPPITTSSANTNSHTSCAPVANSNAAFLSLKGCRPIALARRGPASAIRSDTTVQGSCSWPGSDRSAREQPNRRGSNVLDARKSPRFEPFARCSQEPQFLLVFSPNSPPNAENGLPNACAAQEAKPCRPAPTILVRHPFESCTVFVRENRSCSFAIGCGQPLRPPSQPNHVPAR